MLGEEADGRTVGWMDVVIVVVVVEGFFHFSYDTRTKTRAFHTIFRGKESRKCTQIRIQNVNFL